MSSSTSATPPCQSPALSTHRGRIALPHAGRWSVRRPAWRLSPLSQAMAALAIAGTASGAAQAQTRAFSPGWFADKNAAQSTAQRTGRMPDGSVAGIGNSAKQQAQSRQQLQKSLDNLNRTVAAVAAQQAAQAAARAAAAANGTDVPDGRTEGGLWEAQGALATWEGAKTATTASRDGKHIVTIEQTQSRAILNWDTFNVGRNTTVQFKQDPSDAVLNRVVGAGAKPSQIQGAIKADGTVLVVNQNGVIFGGASQVNVRNLVAAAATITDAQFRDKGLFVDVDGTQPTFKDALGQVQVQAGARIDTAVPTTATKGGGYVLLLGSDVHNAGGITTPRGQTVLAAGDDFIIRRGYGTDGNPKSTTTGNEVSATLKPGSTAGLARNTGLISAPTGDITLTGHDVRQDGVLLSTTDIGARGAIHLLNRASDTTGSVTLGVGSVTAVLLEASAVTGLDSQRQAAIKTLDGTATNKATGAFDNLSTVADRLDLSRIEVVTGNVASFQDASTILATGGQIAVSAKKQAVLESGAELDVAGAIGVKVSMESNNLQINVQGNEQRDAPVNRDSKLLNNSDVWVDRRTLVKVASGTNGYAGDRWYTSGGLLEVGGYLVTSERGASEWLAQGGTATFTGGELVTRAGSSINLSGGTLDVQDGKIRLSWLRGADGRLYEVSRAPGDLLYTGLYQGYEDKHARWGDKATRTFYNPLIAPQERLESGYTVGRDAGQLIVSTAAAQLAGSLTGEVYQGARQIDTPQWDTDGYYQSQTAVARRAQLVVGRYTPIFDASTNMLAWTLGGVARQVTAGVGEAGDGEIRLDAAWLNAANLGGIKLAGTEQVAVSQALRFAPGAGVVLYAPQVNIDAGILAAGGRIVAGNVLKQWNANGRNEDTPVMTPAGLPTGVMVGAGAILDTGGLWSNLLAAPQASGNLAYRNGGSVSLRNTHDVTLAAGSVVEVSGGAAMLSTGKTRNGKGGDVTLAAGTNAAGGILSLEGAIIGHGVDGGGTLTLQADSVRIVTSDQVAAAMAGAKDSGVSILSDDAFARGFSQYEVIGLHGLDVAEGAQLRVTMPVQRYASGARALQDKTQALPIWTPALYQEDAIKSVLTQRKGASLMLQAGTLQSTADDLSTTRLHIGDGARIDVDPGQKIALTGVGQITLNGALTAPGGTVSVRAIRNNATEDVIAIGHGRSIWLGEHAVIDVSGRAATAIDHQGQTYGWAQDGGSIVLGSMLDTALGVVAAPDLFVVTRPGSRLDASGSAATVRVNGVPTDLAGAGGTIAISSANGLYLDGQMHARSGGSGAAAGTLSVALDAPAYLKSTLSSRVDVGRDLLVSQQKAADALAGVTDAESAADWLRYGHGELSVEQVQAAGFGGLNLLSNGNISFTGDLSLRMDQSLRLFSLSLGMTETAASNARVQLAAPYVMLGGATDNGALEGYVRPSSVRPPSTRLSESVLAVDAGFIDIRDAVVLGALSTTHSPEGTTRYVGTGFALGDLRSQGDIRVLGGRGTQVALSNQPYTTLLSAPGNLSLTAAQIYPDTGAFTRIMAGLGGKRDGIPGYEEGSTITIRRSTDTLPAIPYSTFGSLRLGADIIDQGGVIRAPLGLLQIGGVDTIGSTSRVSLLPGSITSVSGRGLIMPYGGTVDGVSYQYAGQNVALTGQGAATIQGELLAGLQLAGEDVHVGQGALLDLSGGGQLLGAGFVTGRGGSTDARFSPLMQANANGQGFTLPGLATNPVYALVPGAQVAVAPTASDAPSSRPQIGQQVTIGSGVPGLPAGMYTLMPSTYAVLPGAFRVEINGAAKGDVATGALAMRNGSWAIAGRMGTAGASISNLPTQLVVTSGQVLRQYSQYNEMDYAAFVQADAARRGVPRAMLPADARTLKVHFDGGAEGQAFSFAGQANFSSQGAGHGGTLAITSNAAAGTVEITAANAGRSAGFSGLSLDAGQVTATGAPRITLGAVPYVDYQSFSNLVDFGYAGTHFNSLVLRDGATLSAAEVFMVTSGLTTGITIERGASINTIGRGKAPFDSAAGYTYSVRSGSMLALSNGWINLLPPTPDEGISGAGPISIGACGSVACLGESQLYTEGTLAASTNKRFDLSTAVGYGARYLTLAVGTINAGSEQALAAAAARGSLTDGLTLNQTLLNRLLAGDQRFGAPALEMLTLAVSDSFNFFENITLDTMDPATGKSRLQTLALTTPAIYGYGQAGDAATLRVGNLIWNGSTTPPVGVVNNGAGTGRGVLDIHAEQIQFGYGPYTQPLGELDNARLTLGFAAVNLNASDRITTNHRGSLNVYQSRGAYDPATGWTYHGGTLNLNTPLLTGEAGSVNRIKAGDAIRLASPVGSASAAEPRGLGAELALQAGTLDINGRIALPTGKLSLRADQALTLADSALLDVAGRPVPFDDVTKYSWGGDVNLESLHGNITQAAGSRIDLSAQYNRAGRLTAVALDDAAGRIDLQGRILGSASGLYDAGGTLVPYAFGDVDIRAQQLDFTVLNQRLNEGRVFGGRSFQIKRGNLLVGDEVRARNVNISVDAGSLTVAGRIDASGAAVGSIRLAARDGLRLASNAVLDAHGETLRVDSYGKIIDAPNRAIVELNSGQGLLQLEGGARIDLRAGVASARHDGLPRGTLELNAPRLGGITGGDINIDARGPLDIQGARSIAVNGVWVYTDAPAGTEINAGGKPYQVIDQDYLNRLHGDSRDFIGRALANGNLLNTKLAGLRAYGDALHLRPGVEIRSATPDGDLVVQGDLDLSSYRYASLNPHTPLTTTYGSGEVGTLAIRAGGDLQIHGSINDGFAPPPVVTQDLNGWRLLPGVDFTGGDMITPHAGVVLARDTIFLGGVTLNYDVPLQGATISKDVVLPVTAPLAQELTLPAGTVLSAPIMNADGSVAHAAGTVLREALTLPVNMRLGAGTRLLVTTVIGAVTWPAGVALPNNGSLLGGNQTNEVKLASEVTLPRGALIPSGTNVKLRAGVEYIDLRPAVNGAQGQVWAVASMLPEGSQSWSLRLVSGADLNAADTRSTQFGVKGGDLVLADSHYGMYGFDGPRGFIWTDQVSEQLGMPELVGQPVDDALAQSFGYADANALCLDNPDFCSATGERNFIARPGTARYSVVRTGTGDLDLLAGGSLRTQSLYGVYTAGTSSVATAQGDPYNQPRLATTAGPVLRDPNKGFEAFVDGGEQSTYRAWYPDGGGNLTLRAGANLTGDLMASSSGAVGRPLELSRGYNTDGVGNWLWRQGSGDAAIGQAQPTAWWINFGTYIAGEMIGSARTADEMRGFTGFGTLGGGNLDIDVRGDAGIQTAHPISDRLRQLNPRSQALVLAVGSTGRMLADGTLALTGGGDITMRVGGSLNPALPSPYELAGTVTNLRGQSLLQAASMGRMDPLYDQTALGDTRPRDRFKASSFMPTGGMTLLPGDSVFQLQTLGDLTIMAARDAGRATLPVSMPYLQADGTPGVHGANSWFSLWTVNTAVDLFSAGGNVAPITNPNTDNDGVQIYPSQFSAVAANGSIRYNLPVGLAPGASARLDLLAGDSIYGSKAPFGRISAAIDSTASIYRPAFVGKVQAPTFSNIIWGPTTLSPDGAYKDNVLFAFGSISAATSGIVAPTRLYARDGDLVGVSSGRLMQLTNGALLSGTDWYVAGGPVRMIAGRDIVGSGSVLGQQNSASEPIPHQYRDNLFVHGDAQDVSVVRAGRDILYSSFTVAGPGTLEISAGGSILMEDKAAVVSLGPIVAGDTRRGASIVMQAGLGTQGADYAGFLRHYLDAGHAADPSRPLTDQGKPFKTYEAELLLWLTQAYGFAGNTDDARAFFDALPPEPQRIFARQVYFAELRAGGREYNDKTSPREGSYLRGRQAIAALFPGQQTEGQAPSYDGSITMYGGAGLQTRNGGDIQVLTPGGAQVYGVEGTAPPSTAGVVTQGSGTIQLYAQDSILLGQSRVMTTFGGDILAWSAQGDINAGRGSKTTVVYTPPRRVYDGVGNISLSPIAPSSGAGIATLAPLAEVPAGDVDLYAPLGTIDAGEAGIRVSGNVNIAAQSVLNAANIKTKGDSVGLPPPATVNTGALTSASSAATSAATAAQESAQRAQNQARQNQPSIFSVQILGFGAEPVSDAPAASNKGGQASLAPTYRPNNMVQVVGDGALTPAQLAKLTTEEKQAFGL
ncbi:filamentous haemagglutinin family protein [Achromobacter pestifer]